MRRVARAIKAGYRACVFPTDVFVVKEPIVVIKTIKRQCSSCAGINYGRDQNGLCLVCLGADRIMGEAVLKSISG